MQTSIERHDKRRYDELRRIAISYNVQEHASGSLLFQMGKTKVLCAVTMQNNVPPFLRGKSSGWLTAEYAMLPTATAVRTQRESNQSKRNGRSIEISRLIGRTLRSVVNLAAVPDRTIVVDCDVLQADGGTRTACITAASLALHQAQAKWIAAGKIEKSFMKDHVAALSVGIMNQAILLDIDYYEDSRATADFNFILTRSGNIIEIQGGAEQEPISWKDFEQMRLVAINGIEALFKKISTLEKNTSGAITTNLKRSKSRSTKPPMFSLLGRQKST